MLQSSSSTKICRNSRGDLLAFLSVQDLRKTFLDRKRTVEAVRGVSFSISEGEMVGLLGPNGAGKTTTIKCVLGLVKPESGRILVDGIDAAVETRKSSAKLAAVLEGARNTYWRLTVWENIVYFSGIHGISESRGKEYFQYLLEMLGLEDKRNVEVGKLSSGFKQKTAVACALSKRTPIVFLDEPTLGLDVESSYELREALLKLKTQENRTIVISSHDLRVIQDTCDRVIIMSDGRLVADQGIQELLSLFRTRKVRVVVPRNGDTESIARAQTEAKVSFPDCEIRQNPQSIEIVVSLSEPREIYELMSIMEKSQVAIETISQEEVDLERAFLQVVRRENSACG